MVNQVNKPFYERKEIDEPMYADAAMIVCPDVRVRYKNTAAQQDSNIVKVFTRRWIR